MKLPTKSYAQAAQDTWALRCNHWATNGFYVDLGAHDGINHSNTALLDLEYGWQGICVEANEAVAEVCRQNRPNAQVVTAAVSDHEGTIHFWDQWETQDQLSPVVRCATLQTILDECGARKTIDYKTIDYMSIDIEGMEYDTLAAFDFDAYHVHLLTVEHNLYAHGPTEKDRIYELLTSKGFVRTVNNAVCLDAAYAGSEYEDWYVHPVFLQSCSDEAYTQ